MMVSIIEIVLYTKPTAEHQYLLHSSCHPLQTKRAFPFSLALRIRRICSSNETSSLGLLNQEIQRVHIYYHTLSLKRLTHAYSSSFRIPPSHSLNIIYITSPFTFSHPPNFVLPCLNIYLSFPSYVLRSWTFAKWTSRLEQELSINVMVLYTVQSPLFFGKIV